MDQPDSVSREGSQRVARPTSWDGVGESGVEPSTDIHPWHLTGDRNAAVAIGQHLGDGVHTHWQETGDTTGYLWLLAAGHRGVPTDRPRERPNGGHERVDQTG